MTRPDKVERLERRRDDQTIIAAIADGDLTGLGCLFERYGEDVRGFLSRLGVVSFDLDDVVQQTFLDVPHASVSFRQGAAVRPWLFGLATNVARRRRRLLSRMLARLQAWALAPPAPPTPSAHEEYELKVEAWRAQRALDSISTKKREAFVLVIVEGLSGAEAAEALGVPLSTVWTRIHHARAELRALLEEPQK